MALGQLLPVLAEDVGDVRIDRESGTEGLEDDDLLRSVGNMVVPPDHVGDLVHPVVHGRGEVVDGPAVGTEDDHVLELACGELDPALDGVLPGDDALGGHPDPDRAVVRVGLAFRDEPRRLQPAPLGTVELEPRRSVPLDPEPEEGALDLLDRFGHLAARVGVLDPQQALAAAAAREEPVEQKRAHPTDVEEPRRARCHANADGHQARIVGANALREDPPVA